MLVNMARGLAERGVGVDFWTSKRDRPFVAGLPDGVNGIFARQSRLPLWLQFIAYLRARRPDIVLAGKDRALLTALRIRRLSGAGFKLVARPGTNLTERHRGRGPWRRHRALARARRIYRGVDLVVANSRGVAEDVATIAGLPVDAIPVVRNPVITPELPKLAAENVDHPWLVPGQPPLVLGVGGFRRQKDFETLVQAFALVRQRRPCRLIILGRGHLMNRIRQLGDELGVAGDLGLPGFVENPYPFMARAALFVLSSRWEGSPNALTEALALGTPVVSTDCPSGPRELLRDGEVAPLVKVGDSQAMAAAMERVLDGPPPAERLQAAVAEYTMERNAAAYHALFAALLADRPMDGRSPGPGPRVPTTDGSR